MSTPLGTFVRAKRDGTEPAALGLPNHQARRAPGLRRTELAARAGISVEYLTRIEQGRDRNPSEPVINALADALALDAAERTHLRYLAKISSGACAGRVRPAPPPRTVRPSVRQVLDLVEPGVAHLTNRLGDILAHTSAFATLMRDTGLLDPAEPNLTRYVFTDPRARVTFPGWDQVADEQVFNLWLGPSTDTFEWFTADFAPVAGTEFTRRLHRHVRPPQRPLRMGGGTWNRETLELPDAQQIVIWLPAEEAAVRHLRAV